MRKIIDPRRRWRKPSPYSRGLISDVGDDLQRGKSTRPHRQRGKTKIHFFVLIDIAVLGFTISFSVTSRFAMLMVFPAGGSRVLGAGDPDSKLLFWNLLTPGLARYWWVFFSFGLCT